MRNWSAGLAVLIACWALAAHAEAPTVARARILWAGLYQAEITGTLDQPDTAMGKTNELAHTRKLGSTTTVEGRLGVSFGFEYTLAGAPAGASVPINIVVILPKEGLQNPARAERTYRERWLPEQRAIGSETSLVGYTFEHAWEIVPGLWTFEVWSGEQKLGQQAFCVVAERPASEEAEGKKPEPCKSVPTV